MWRSGTPAHTRAYTQPPLIAATLLPAHTRALTHNPRWLPLLCCLPFSFFVCPLLGSLPFALLLALCNVVCPCLPFALLFALALCVRLAVPSPIEVGRVLRSIGWGGVEIEGVKHEVLSPSACYCPRHAKYFRSVPFIYCLPFAWLFALCCVACSLKCCLPLFALCFVVCPLLCRTYRHTHTRNQ